MNRLRRIGLVVLSGGWLVLVWHSVVTAGGLVLKLFRHFASGGTGWPSALAGNSFPIEEFTFQVAAWEFTIGCAWLLIAIVYWVLRQTRPTVDPRDA